MSKHVTEILDYLTEPELLAWMLRTSKANREAMSQDSLAIGSYVDLIIQRDLFPARPTDDLPQPTPAQQVSITNCVNAWNKFKIDRPDITACIKDIQVELEHGDIVGHPDIFYEEDSRWGIIDIKTSRTMYPRYWTQIAEYTELKCLADYKYVDKPRFIAILRLDKESGLYHYAEIADEAQIAYEVGVFNAYRMAYDHNFNSREFILSQLEMEIIK